jgi:hypothetical protein
LSGHFFGVGNAQRVINHLKSLREAYDVKILLVVREQFSYLRSAYKFVVLLGQMRSQIEPFCRNNFEHILERLDYAALLHRYIEAFRDAHVCAVPYELLIGDGASFHEEIGRFAGVSVKPYRTVERAANAGIWGERLIQRLVVANRHSGTLRRWEHGARRRLFRGKAGMAGLRENRWVQAFIVRCLAAVTRDERDIGLPSWFTDAASGFVCQSNRRLQDHVGFDLTGFGYRL